MGQTNIVRVLSRWIPAVAMVIGAKSDATAQCAVTWTAPAPPQLVAPSFAACVWDADGQGPLTPRLVVSYQIPWPPSQFRTAIAALDPGTGVWTTLASPIPGSVFCLLPLPNGDLLAGGEFSTVQGVPAFDLARFDGSSWVGVGHNTSIGQVHTLAARPNGDLLVGGSFAAIGPFPGLPADGAALWNGTVWQSLDLPVGGGSQVGAIVVMPNGDFVVGGTIIDSSWSSPGLWHLLRRAPGAGAAWSTLGPGLNGQVNTLLVLPNGNLMAGGLFTAAGSVTLNRVGLWDGTAWQPLGSGANGAVTCSTLLPNGDLVVGGAFTTIGGVAANNIARWDGSAWHALGGGVGYSVRGVAASPQGQLLVSGFFTSVNGGAGSFVALAQTTCPATVAPIATACVGPAGPLSLSAGPPWLGTTWASSATGFANNSLAFPLLGFQPATTPLSNLHPAGIANCSLLASPDILGLALPVNGTASFQIVLPNSSALVNVPLFHQFVQVELDAQGAIQTISSSNGLRVVLGDY